MTNNRRPTHTLFDHVPGIYGWLTNTPLWRESIREMARHLPPSAATLRLIDVGCGPGNSALQLLTLRPDLRIIGVDYSAGMLRRARLACVQHGKTAQISWTQGNAAALPLPDSSADAITLHSAYYLLPDRAAFLHEAMRVLRPGGRLIMLDPAAVRYPYDAILRLKDFHSGLSVMLWHGVSRTRHRFSVHTLSGELIQAGFARVLAENTVRGYAILSRGEKPYDAASTPSTVERIAQTAAHDQPSDGLQIVDASALDTVSRGKFIFVLVKQTPNKPQWALKPDDVIHWDAAMVSGASHHPYLLAFTSLPKAVEFMQPAVTSGLLKDINKVAKFDKAVGVKWGCDVLVNPPFEALRSSELFTFGGASLAVDPTTGVSGEE